MRCDTTLELSIFTTRLFTADAHSRKGLPLADSTLGELRKRFLGRGAQTKEAA